MAMTLRISEEQDKRLTTVAESLGISKNQVAIEAIDAFIEREWQKAVAKKVIATVGSAFDFVIGVATDKYDLDQMAAWIKEHKTIRQ